MEITIKSTDEFVEINGVHCRKWDGMTAEGFAPCIVFVQRIAMDNEDATAFGAELTEQRRGPTTSLLF